MLLFLCAGALNLAAQESELPLGINLPTAETLLDGHLGVRFTHRFLQPARAGSKDLYGLDNGNYPGLGLDVSLKAIAGLNAQLYRTADNKTLVLALQQRLVNGPSFSLSARVERYDETIKELQLPSGSVGLTGVALQLPTEFHLGASFTLLLVPTYLSHTSSENKPGFNVGAGVRWQLAEGHALLAEFYPRPARLEASRYHPGAALGYRYGTRGHRFTLVASNTTGTTAHQVLGGDYGGGPKPFSQWSLGFNLVRLF